MAIYLEYDGINGNVTADGYQDQIGVLSFAFGVGRAISMEPGNMANREATRPSVSEVTVTKMMDNASSSLFKEAVTGSAGKTVKLHFVATGADKVVFTCTSGNARAAAPKDLAEMYEERSGRVAQTADNLSDALQIAHNAVSREDIICVCGSFYLVGEAKALLAN